MMSSHRWLYYGRTLVITAPLFGKEIKVPGRALACYPEVLYERLTDNGPDPNVLFVLEAAAVHLKEGRRQLRTAINFTPTHGRGQVVTQVSHSICQSNYSKSHFKMLPTSWLNCGATSKGDVIAIEVIQEWVHVFR